MTGATAVVNQIMGWLWNMFIFGGTAYYVFERGESPWWFVLPIIFVVTQKSKK